MSGIFARLSTVCCVVSLAACSSLTLPNQTAALPNAQMQRSLRPTTTSQENLYVLNDGREGGYVTVYRDGTSHVLYKIERGARYGDEMILGPTGNVYLWSYLPSTSIIVFAAKTNKRLYTINGGKNILGIPAVDHQDELYVPIPEREQIFVYGAGTRKIVRKINVDFGEFPAMTFDSHNNLFVIKAESTIVEFAAGTDKLIRTVYAQTNSFQMAVDASGDLYVLSYPSIEVFAPHKSKPELKITEGLSNPHTMALDSNGNLFVLNEKDITAYARGTTSPYVTFNRNNANEDDMVIDTANNLYVTGQMRGHFNLGYFKVFALPTNKLVRTVSRDVSEPFGLAVGPNLR